MDMSISTSEISNITGPGEADSIYEITVIDEGTLGDKTVVQSSGTSLGSVSSSNIRISPVRWHWLNRPLPLPRVPIPRP